METLDEKLKQFKPAKAVGDGYPRGYKSSINAYMQGYNSGRFNAYLSDDFVENHRIVNDMMREYNKLVQMNWEIAKCKAVVQILDLEGEQRKAELLYGSESKENKLAREKIIVLEFLCKSLPPVSRSGKDEQLN